MVKTSGCDFVLMGSGSWILVLHFFSCVKLVKVRLVFGPNRSFPTHAPQLEIEKDEIACGTYLSVAYGRIKKLTYRQKRSTL